MKSAINTPFNFLPNNNKGFTLIEILLVIALISSLTFLSLPLTNTIQMQNDLDVANAYIVQSLRRAQILASGGEKDSPWGVSLQSGSITIFKGTSYASRDQAFDEATPISTAITINGTKEYSFAKLTGEPQASGTITLTNTTGQTRSISMNSKGTVSY